MRFASRAQRRTGGTPHGHSRTLTFESPAFAMAGSYPVIPASDTTLYSLQDYQVVRVERGPDGKVAALVWGQNRFARME